MLKYFSCLSLFLFVLSGAKAQATLPPYYATDVRFDSELREIVNTVGLDSSFYVGDDGRETISFAVIDLNGERPLFGGVNYENFIYPASVYKMYVAMEILKQVSEGHISLFEDYVVASPNDVDKTKEISYDPRPLLKAGDTVTIHYLLDLMITRSDNSAANCLIDIADRPNINMTMLEHNWGGSEVTRKFLRRSLEAPGYASVRSTETCALHAADFMYRVHTQKLINPWVSMQIESLLALQLDTTKLSSGLPDNAMFFHKTGWWSYYTHDTGIVNDGKIKYIISLFTPVAEEKVRPRMKELSRKVYDLIRKRNND